MFSFGYEELLHCFPFLCDFSTYPQEGLRIREGRDLQEVGIPEPKFS